MEKRSRPRSIQPFRRPQSSDELRSVNWCALLCFHLIIVLVVCTVHVFPVLLLARLVRPDRPDVTPLQRKRCGLRVSQGLGLRLAVVARVAVSEFLGHLSPLVGLDLANRSFQTRNLMSARS